MSKFDVLEMELIVRCKIATYYRPATLTENHTKLQRQINSTLQEAGKDMGFLASPVSVTFTMEKANERTNTTQES